MPSISGNRKRCAWTASGNALLVEYHDAEWGVPVYDERRLLEFLILEGAQAGLSWQTVLNKRENYRKAFSGFDAAKIARYGRRDVERLLGDVGIIRNRLKIEATITNARQFLSVQEELGSFSDYLWQFVGGEPMQHRFRSLREIPAKTKQSDAMSNDLRQRGFRFVGSTICYAFMQAVGMVNDHTTDCFRHAPLSRIREHKK